MPSPAPSPASVDTVIIGSGPAALLLSFILHGNIPHHRASAPHPDHFLNAKLPADLFDVDIADLESHFQSSRFSYSTAALPINVLFDTLLRPLADTDPEAHESSIEWRQEPEKSVRHVIIGDSPPGGVWTHNTVPISGDIGALSYVDQLSLPGYSLQDYLAANDCSQPSHCERPSRRAVAEYLLAYPAAVGIGDSISPVSRASDIKRTEGGFLVGSHNLKCRHLVLASGIFSGLISPPPLLRPLLRLGLGDHAEAPLLVVGSGFTAADLILTYLHKRRILHVFRWDPEDRPSPLRACHKEAYPDYARIYRLMKKAARSALGEAAPFTPLARARSKPLDKSELDSNYEGIPNAVIEHASSDGLVGKVAVRLHNGSIMHREISGLQYVVGRRGSLEYLDSNLQAEIIDPDRPEVHAVSGKTLRSKVAEDPEVAPDVFAVGSLAGDSLIRFAYGTCIRAAGKIIARNVALAGQSGYQPTGAAATPAAPSTDAPQAADQVWPTSIKYMTVEVVALLCQLWYGNRSTTRQC